MKAWGDEKGTWGQRSKSKQEQRSLKVFGFVFGKWGLQFGWSLGYNGQGTTKGSRQPLWLVFKNGPNCFPPLRHRSYHMTLKLPPSGGRVCSSAPGIWTGLVTALVDRMWQKGQCMALTRPQGALHLLLTILEPVHVPWAQVCCWRMRVMQPNLVCLPHW